MKEKISLEKLTEQGWNKTDNFANNCVILRHGHERIIYDLEKKEVVHSYRTDERYLK